MSNVFSASSLTIVKVGASSTFGAASTGASIPTAQSGEVPRFIRVAATNACYFRIGSGAQTAVIGDLLIQPADAVVLQVPSGVNAFAALQVAAGGVVVVSPLENC